MADAFRRRRRREALSGALQFDHEGVSAGEGPTPLTEDDERLAEVELASCLRSLIGHMQEPYRQAIELTEIRGMTQLAAARVAGVSISGMKSRVQRGRRQLETVIQEFCRIETDVRGGVIECAPLRPLQSSSDSMDMSNTSQSNTTDAKTTEAKTTETTSDHRAAPTGCCGGAAPKGSSACCARDAEVKATGGSGCGCASKAASPAKKGCC